MTAGLSTAKRVKSLVYLYLGAEYFTGRTAQLKLLNSQVLDFRFTSTTFTQVTQEQILSYTSANPLTQEELDHISLPNYDMLRVKVVIIEVELYVVEDVCVRMAFTKGNKLKWPKRSIQN